MNERNPKVLDKSIRVLLIAKYPIVLDCLALLIEKSRGITISGTHLVAEWLENATAAQASDVAVIYMSRGDGVETVAEIRDAYPELRIILLIEGYEIDTQAAALKLGVAGIVQKEQNSALLIEAIRQTHEGKTWLNQGMLNLILNGDKLNGKAGSKLSFQLGAESLTAREIQVVKMIGRGLKNKLIAEELSICGATVRHHLSTIYGKTGVEDRLNLVIFAYRNGLIDLQAETEGTV